MSKKGLLQHVRDALAGLAVDRKAAKLGPESDDDGVLRASSDWKPDSARKRIEIMVTGDPSRVGAIADIIDDLQKQVFGGPTQLENLQLRITGFLDGCIHRSKWGRKPFKAAQEARNWHCDQSGTRFADAFAKSSGEMVDAVILVGHRFDDDMQEALKQADQLKEQGVAIHCFHTGNDQASRAAYEKLAQETDGVFMQLPDQRSIGEVMPILMAHIHDDESLLMLDPQSETARQLKNMLISTEQAQFLSGDEADKPIIEADDDLES
jgi:hypothetical protein